MEQSPKICVIVASHISLNNRIPHLITCLHHLFNQTSPVTVYLSISFKNDELRTEVMNLLSVFSQQYPPDSFGIQNIFKEFPTNNAVTENGKELYFPKGGRGFEGEPGVPPIFSNKDKFILKPRDSKTSQMKHISMALDEVKNDHDWIMFCDDDDTYDFTRVEKFLPLLQKGIAGAFESWVGMTQQKYRYEFWTYCVRPFVLMPFFEFLKDHPDILDQSCCDIMLVEYLRRLNPTAYRFLRLDIPENSPLYYYRKENNEYSITEHIIKAQDKVRVGNPPEITDVRFSDYIVEWNEYLYQNLHIYMHDVYLRTVVGCEFEYILQKEFHVDYKYLEYVDPIHVETLRRHHERVRDVCERLYQVWDLDSVGGTPG